MNSCAADFFSCTPTHAAEPSSARIAAARQAMNSVTPLMSTADASGTVQGKWADLTDPEAAHLLLGLNLEGLRAQRAACRHAIARRTMQSCLHILSWLATLRAGMDAPEGVSLPSP